MAESPRVVSIYALLDERRQVRYIGQSGNPKWRVKKHWRERGSRQVDQKNPGLTRWLKSLESAPDAHVFQEVPYVQRFAAEAYWTDLLRRIPGVDLLNIATGSQPSAETRAKWSAVRKGRPVSSEVREKLRQAGVGRTFSPEARARMRAAHLGKALSAEAIATRSETVRGSKRSAEARQRMSESAKARDVQKLWCEDCRREWTRSAWPRHIRKYHEGGAW